MERMGHVVSYWGMADGDKYTATAYPQHVDYSKMSFRERICSPITTIYSKENRRLFGLFIDDFCPDIIHVHNFNYQLTPSILLEGKSRNIPIVYTAHDSQLVCPFHRLYNFEQDATCELCANKKFYQCVKTRCFNGSLFKSALGSIESYIYHLFNIYNKTISRIVSPSRFLANRLSPAL